MNQKLGLALGSGAARGLSHFGVIRALKRENVEPDVIVGTSIGALVAAAYVTNTIDELEKWFKEQSTTKMLRHLDIKLFPSGGIADGEQFIQFLKSTLGDFNIEDLDKPFAAVTCDLKTGKEVWLTEGSIWDAVRASAAYPGLLTPVQKENHWYVDGGIVNPVPVSVCRALGATSVIAVNLNHDLLHTRMKNKERSKQLLSNWEDSVLGKVSQKFKSTFSSKLKNAYSKKNVEPGILDVISSTVSIMQDRITRSRLAGDPPDIIFNPRLSNIGFLETDKAEEIILEGERCVLRNIDQLQWLKEILNDDSNVTKTLPQKK